MRSACSVGFEHPSGSLVQLPRLEASFMKESLAYASVGALCDSAKRGQHVAQRSTRFCSSWEAANEHFKKRVMARASCRLQTTVIAHLGGATLDIEENYLSKKLFMAERGMICFSN